MADSVRPGGSGAEATVALPGLEEGAGGQGAEISLHGLRFCPEAKAISNPPKALCGRGVPGPGAPSPWSDPA